ncbi:hypothetical protein AK812_SmicGene12051 [Symbiodinium microadriaticum]|uniref:Uncharacterized protein n=1 Tax=Symbiodinium microadriaticum TaxID=2951 RepID=A0A1Q9EBM0_SYMMI|nr:hypothetical protein AK812_SmicGene12051 [Symbiodinium microadriaticum]
MLVICCLNLGIGDFLHSSTASMLPLIAFAILALGSKVFFLYEVKFAPFAPASCKERLPCGGSSRVRKSIVHSASFQSRGQDLFGEGLWQGQILPVLVSLQKLLGTSTKKALFGHDRVTAVFSLLKCSAIETFRSDVRHLNVRREGLKKSRTSCRHIAFFPSCGH